LVWLQWHNQDYDEKGWAVLEGLGAERQNGGLGPREKFEILLLKICNLAS